MLYYDLERIYKARGIENPSKFLLANGFSERYSQKLKNGRVTDIKLKYLEKFCELFNCTPNDILVWEPDKNTSEKENHPLSMFRSKNKAPDVLKEIRTMPMAEINELQEFLDKRKENEITQKTENRNSDF